MGDHDRGPEKIDVEQILAGGDPGGGEQVEVLDPATGQPVATMARHAGTADQGALAAAVAEKEKFYDLWVRGRADFENYQKRIERERADERARAGAALAQDLLPTLDNLDRALAAQPAGEPFRDGIALIRRQLGEALLRAGLAPIEATGAPFDPVYHEAVLTEATDALPPNHVTEEIQKGYTFSGRVLRPALVKVSKAMVESPAPGMEQTDSTD